MEGSHSATPLTVGHKLQRVAAKTKGVTGAFPGFLNGDEPDIGVARDDMAHCSAKTAAAQGLVVLRGIGVFLGANGGRAHDAAVLVLVAGRQDEKKVAANRPCCLTGRTEELGSLESLVITIVAHGEIFDLERGHVKRGRGRTPSGQRGLGVRV